MYLLEPTEEAKAASKKRVIVPPAPQAMHGSASPQGEAPRKAPPSRRKAPGAAGRITGGGGWVV